jgi:hypothetical protein
MRNFFEISINTLDRAAAKRIELRPFPCVPGFLPTVTYDTPRGHYIILEEYRAQIIAVDDYRSAANTYGDLIDGYVLSKIHILPIEEGFPLSKKFVSMEYLRE